jgi:hypothetical protein
VATYPVRRAHLDTPMPTPPSRLPRKIQNALSLIDSVVLAYDRLHFWLDHPLPLIPSVLRDDERVSIMPRSMQYRPVWQTKIELLQPDADLLRACIDMAGERYRVIPNYVEIKLDLLTRTGNDAKLLQEVLLEHLIVKSCSYPVKIEKGTAYYMPLITPSGKPLAFNFVIYADKPNKETGCPCCHLEWRLRGVGALETVGLNALDSCVDFDHRDYWSKRLHLFSPPSKAALARWLDSENANVSSTMLTKRADQFLRQYMHDDTFIVQNCYVEHREIIELLTPVDNAWFLPD